MRDSFGHYLFELICKRSQNLIASHTFFFLFHAAALLVTLYTVQTTGPSKLCMFRRSIAIDHCIILYQI
jgi:hypothetical protein